MYKFLIIIVLSILCYCNSSIASPLLPKQIELSDEETIAFTYDLLKEDKLNEAKTLLQNIELADEYEIERKFLLGKIASSEGDFETAIKYFRNILDSFPNLAKVRLELALAYMMMGSWYRADYHLRLASSEDIPEVVNENIKRLLLVIRQNKNWNIWFNVGVAPDNNINNAQYGKQCINTIFGVLCNELPAPEHAVGLNLSFGGDYEYKITDRLRLKNDFAFINSTYNKKEYDDLYLLFSTGPKWVYKGGDIWGAVTTSKRWLSHQQYSDTLGFKIQTSYDFSRNLQGFLNLYYTPTHYKDYKYLDGNLTGGNLVFTYMLSSTMYLRLKTGIEKENTEEKIYTNLKSNYALGFGAELTHGFTIYLEPSIQYVDYAHEGLFVNDGTFTSMKEKDITRRYSISIANKKIDIYGFTPTITYSYTDKDSNVWQKEYDKSTVEFTINQRF
ncbi:MAG: surface lipoprotein assembly modifier [Alphaproteobacteria bacterium]